MRWLTVSATLIKFKERPAIQAAFIDITEPKRAEEALARSEAQYRLVLENIDEIVYQVSTPDADLMRGRVLFVSPRAETIIGCKAEDFLADPGLWFSLLHPEDVAAVVSQTQAMLAQRQGGTREYRLRHKNTGEYRWMEDHVRLQVDGAGRVVGIFGVARDMTERKRAAEAYQTLVECSLQGLVIVQDGRITFANPAAAASLGGSVEELIALSPEGVVELVHPEDRPFVLQRQKDRLAGQPTPPHYEFRIVRKDGAVRWVEIFASLTHFRQGPAIQTTFIDITERKEAERNLRQYTEELHALSRRLLEVQEAERRHVARELHDELGQHLTALKYNLEAAVRLPEADLRAKLGEQQAALSQFMQTLCELSLELRPPMLDSLGLLHTLVWYCDRFEAQFHIRVDFQHRGLEGKRFAPEIETAAFRIVQESLTNVARHAGVSAVQVTAQVEPHQLWLAISDQGKGFDPEQMLLAGHTSGLSGMRERASLLGGSVTIESAPGAGTRLTADLPLPVAPGAPLVS